MGLEFCSLASGSSGNCQYIRSRKAKILLDAGLSGKYIINGLDHLDVMGDDLDGVLITHEHSDHIKGIGVIHRKFGLNIYVHALTWEAIKDKLGKIDSKKIILLNDESPFEIKDIIIQPHAISHDAVAPLGYSFMTDTAKISVVTDLGCVSEALLNGIKDSHLLMLEANHNVEMLMTGSYPYPLKRRVASDYGHLSNEDCARTVIEGIKNGRVGSVLLGHLSRENNTPDLAYETVKSMMSEEGMIVGEDVQLELTYRDRMGTCFQVGRSVRY